ncbi:MAG TPA: MFS transporter, partial [Jatrophihabitans sp.]|nr:MFS transporter [Jatrophihabitans sp.]
MSSPDQRRTPAGRSGGSAGLSLRGASGRWVLLACVLGSGIAGIDSTVVNIALPDIGRELHVGFASLQWTITAYTLTLAAFILIGGSLGDRLGRRRIFIVGIVWFAAASLLCALASTAGLLIAARALQGIGGALMTPASLAIIQASFSDADRTRAIGAWSGLSGTTSAIAPFLGGWLIQAGSWRAVFLINPPLCALVIALALRHMPETRDPNPTGRLDLLGCVLGVLGLGGVTAGIIAAADHGFGSAAVLLPLGLGALALVAFVLAERYQPDPMMPVSLFASRQFSAANLVTLLLYAANSGALLLLVVELETVARFSPLKAGTALLPITVIMLLFAARFGALAQRIGPRIPMTVGPLVSATGLLLLAELPARANYLTNVLPAVLVLGCGLAIFVAPLTSTVLGAVPAAHAGLASGVNNAVARAAGLISIA